MKETIPPQIATGNILEIIALCGSGKFPKGGDVPTDPVPPSKTVRGTIGRKTSHNIYAAGLWSSLAANAVDVEHGKFHEREGFDVERKKCQHFDDQEHALRARAKILSDLMWLNIQEEIPAMRNNSGSICAKWKLASETDEPWDETKLFPKNNPMDGLVEQIIRIAGGSTISTKGISIESEIEEGDKVIGTITDERIKSLYALKKDITDFAVAQKNNTAQSAATKAVEIIQDIFWRAIRDTVPGGNVAHIKITKDWVLVEAPLKKSWGLGIEIISVGPSGAHVISGSDNPLLGLALLAASLSRRR